MTSMWAQGILTEMPLASDYLLNVTAKTLEKYKQKVLLHVKGTTFNHQFDILRHLDKQIDRKSTS